MPKLWATIQLLIQHRKEREKSELLNILSKKFSNLIYAYHTPHWNDAFKKIIEQE